jgi:hypothetical protein
MNEKSAIAANHPPRRSARLRKWVGVRERRKIRKKKPLDPAAVVRDLSEARNHESVKLGEALCARSIEPFEGGRWRLRWMRANGWTRSNGYGN